MTSSIVCGRPRRLSGDDRGTSLMELLVGMTLLSIFMAMFTGAVVAMNRAENKTESVNLTSAQLNQAFLSLDKSVRYAAAIDAPGTNASGDWYIELRNTTATGTQTCTQLWVSGALQQLRQRAWTVGSAGLSRSAPAFSSLASNVENSPPDPAPFVLGSSGGAGPYQQLTVSLSSPAGSGSTVTTSRSKFTLTSINSKAPGPAGLICQEAGGRP